MEQTALLNLGLGLIGFIAVILVFILKALHHLSNLLEKRDEQSNQPGANFIQPVAADRINEDEVAVIVAVFSMLMPDKKISTIRLR